MSRAGAVRRDQVHDDDVLPLEAWVIRHSAPLIARLAVPIENCTKRTARDGECRCRQYDGDPFVHGEIRVEAVVDVLAAIAWYLDRPWLQARPGTGGLVQPPKGKGLPPGLGKSLRRCGLSESHYHRARRILEPSGLLEIKRVPGRGKAALFKINTYAGSDRPRPLQLVEKGAGTPARRVPERVPPRHPTGPLTHEKGAAPAPHVVGTSGLERIPPSSPHASSSIVPASRPASAVPDADGLPPAVVVPGRCPHADRRGRLCFDCRGCGTSRGAIRRARREAAAADAAAAAAGRKRAQAAADAAAGPPVDAPPETAEVIAGLQQRIDAMQDDFRRRPRDGRRGGGPAGAPG